MALLGVLIAVPLVVAALMLFLKQDSQRDPVADLAARARRRLRLSQRACSI